MTTRVMNFYKNEARIKTFLMETNLSDSQRVMAFHAMCQHYTLDEVELLMYGDRPWEPRPDGGIDLIAQKEVEVEVRVVFRIKDVGGMPQHELTSAVENAVTGDEVLDRIKASLPKYVTRDWDEAEGYLVTYTDYNSEVKNG